MTWKSSNGFRDETIEISTRNLRDSIRRMLISSEALTSWRWNSRAVELFNIYVFISMRSPIFFSLFAATFRHRLVHQFTLIIIDGWGTSENHRKSFSPFGPAGAFDNFHIFGWIVRLDVTQVYQQTVAGVKKLFQVKINIRRDKNVDLMIKWHSIGKS